MADLLKRFDEQNKDIKVVLDQVPYKAINENLPVQLASGQGPDMARVVDMGGLSRYVLDMRPLSEGPRLLGEEFRPVPGMDAPRRRHQGDPGLHDAAHRHRPLRQQDPVRAGRHRDARRQGDLGGLGQGGEGRSPTKVEAPFPLAHRPLGPPLLRARGIARHASCSTPMASPLSSTTASSARRSWSTTGTSPASCRRSCGARSPAPPIAAPTTNSRTRRS